MGQPARSISREGGRRGRSGLSVTVALEFWGWVRFGLARWSRQDRPWKRWQTALAAPETGKALRGPNLADVAPAMGGEWIGK
jgi:sugar lactone lactonase YvrE